MGGPCYVVGPNATDNCQVIRRADTGAPITFMFPPPQAADSPAAKHCPILQDKSQEWVSVEQIFQAAKYADPAFRERFRVEGNALAHKPSKHNSSQMISDDEHGTTMWEWGQERNPSYLGDALWNQVKVDVMFFACMSKYTQCNDAGAGQAQREGLLATGNGVLVGGPSTTWKMPNDGGRETGWEWWNGRIQMLCRELLKGENGNQQATAALTAELTRYREAGW